MVCSSNKLKSAGADIHEILLLAPVEEAIDRFKTRTKSQGFPDGFRPGGITDIGGREAFLARRYNDVLATVALRPNTFIIQSVQHDIDGTYQKLIAAIDQPS